MNPVYLLVIAEGGMANDDFISNAVLLVDYEAAGCMECYSIFVYLWLSS